MELRLVWDPAQGCADLSLVNGQLDLRATLETWVIVSLFTDRRAEPSDQLMPAIDGTVDRKGWWGDTYLGLDHPGDLIGSRLWLLKRTKSWQGLPLVARGYCLEALQWMIEDGIASSIDVRCAFPFPGDTSRLDAMVTITHVSGQTIDFRFDAAWRELREAA